MAESLIDFMEGQGYSPGVGTLDAWMDDHPEVSDQVKAAHDLHYPVVAIGVWLVEEHGCSWADTTLRRWLRNGVK